MHQKHFSKGRDAIKGTLVLVPQFLGWLNAPAARNMKKLFCVPTSLRAEGSGGGRGTSPYLNLLRVFLQPAISYFQQYKFIFDIS